MSLGQTGHTTGQMGRVPGTDGTHTRGCPAKILYVYWFFLSPISRANHELGTFHLQNSSVSVHSLHFMVCAPLNCVFFHSNELLSQKVLDLDGAASTLPLSRVDGPSVRGLSGCCLERLTNQWGIRASRIAAMAVVKLQQFT